MRGGGRHQFPRACDGLGNEGKASVKGNREELGPTPLDELIVNVESGEASIRLGTDVYKSWGWYYWAEIYAEVSVIALNRAVGQMARGTEERSRRGWMEPILGFIAFSL